jgi:hypothetical protein
VTQVVQHDSLMAALNQKPGNSSPDIARTTSDQNLHEKILSLSRVFLIYSESIKANRLALGSAGLSPSVDHRTGGVS